MAKRKPRGPKPTFPVVLYLRVRPELIDALDKRLADEREDEPGRLVSRADVVRRLLWEALS